MSINVMCHGRYWNEAELRFIVDGQTVCFAFEGSAARESMQPHYGLFVEDKAGARAPLRFPKSRRLALLLETPMRGYRDMTSLWERRFGTVFTHDAHLLARGRPYEKLLYGTTWLPELPGETPKTGLVSFMGNVTHLESGAYALRAEVSRQLLDDERVDCWGRGIREIASKLEAIAPYRFSVAMENCREDHYFTEKLIDCFLSRTVPLYWGCDAVGEIFDESGILRFETVDELRALIDGLDASQYDTMRVAVETNRQRAIEGHLSDYTGIFRRVAEALAPRGAPGAALGPVRRSRGMAGLRGVLQRARPDAG